MSATYRSSNGEDAVVVELQNPALAAFLAWCWPGLGHFYQRRFAKGFLFMICIAGTFFYGLGLGQGRCVYASFASPMPRWQFVLQAGVGAPAMFAVGQSLIANAGGDPLFVLCERYPAGYVDPMTSELREYQIIPAEERSQFEGTPIKDGLMAPPKLPVDLDKNDVLGMWHAEMRSNFDIGTLFAIVAGLLNLLVIYDAFAGPAIGEERAPKGEAAGEAAA